MIDGVSDPFGDPFDPEKPVTDLTACRHNTSLADPPLVMISAGPLSLDIENRYMSDEMVEIPLGYYTTSVLSTMQEAIKDIQKPVADGEPITDNKKNELLDQAETVKEKFGDDILKLALSHGIVEVADKEWVEAGIEKQFHNNERAFTHNWKILKGDEDEPVLVIKDQEEESFKRIDIDVLFGFDPEGVKSLLRDYQKAQAGRQYVRNLEYAEALHHIDASPLLPDFLVELGRLKDPEEAETIYKEINLFLSFYDSFSRVRINPNQVYDIQQRLRGPMVELADGRFVNTDGYLEHIAGCESQDGVARLRAVNQINLYRTILGAGRENITEMPEFDDTTKNIFTSPHVHTFYLSKNIGKLGESLSKWQTLARFIKSSSNIATVDESIHAMETGAPASYKRLTDFKEWLESGCSSKTLEGVIGRTANALSSYRPSSVEPLEVIKRAVNEAARHMRRDDKKFSGVRTGLVPSEFEVWDKELIVIISFLASKRMVENSREFYARDPNMEPPEDYLSEWAKENVVAMVSIADAEMASVRTSLDGVEKRLAKTKPALKGLNLTDKDIDIENIATLASKEGGEIDEDAYDFAFIALFMHKNGDIDISNPVFREFFKFITQNESLDIRVLVAGEAA